jgi:hypothetical protein
VSFISAKIKKVFDKNSDGQVMSEKVKSNKRGFVASALQQEKGIGELGRRK